MARLPGPAPAAPAGAPLAKMAAAAGATPESSVFRPLPQAITHTNTEIGVAVRSPELAAQFTSAYQLDAGTGVYEVRLQPDGRSLEWTGTNEDGVKEQLDSPSGVSWFERFRLFMLSRLVPEDWL